MSGHYIIKDDNSWYHGYYGWHERDTTHYGEWRDPGSVEQAQAAMPDFSTIEDMLNSPEVLDMAREGVVWDGFDADGAPCFCDLCCGQGEPDEDDEE